MGCGEDVWKPGRAWPRGGFSLSEAPFISPFVTGDACIVTGRVAAVRISLGSHQPPCASALVDAFGTEQQRLPSTSHRPGVNCEVCQEVAHPFILSSHR